MVKKMCCVSALVILFCTVQAFAQEDRVAQRVADIIEKIQCSKIEGSNLTARIESCHEIDCAVFRVQDELWVETHNITNLVKIWQREKDLIESEIRRFNAIPRLQQEWTVASINGLNDEKDLPIQLRIVLQSSHNNFVLAYAALWDIKGKCTPEEFDEWIQKLNSIFGRDFGVYYKPRSSSSQQIRN